MDGKPIVRRPVQRLSLIHILGVKMRLPVACIQICVADGISAMQHFSVTDINPAMTHARRVIGAFEEHQITGFGRAGRRTDGIEPLGLSLIHISLAIQRQAAAVPVIVGTPF